MSLIITKDNNPDIGETSSIYSDTLATSVLIYKNSTQNVIYSHIEKEITSEDLVNGLEELAAAIKDVEATYRPSE